MFQLLARLLFSTLALAIFSSSLWAQSPPFTECPPVGSSTSCAVLIVIDASGSVTVHPNDAIGDYDGSDDTLVGILNNSAQLITSLQLTGNGIFGLDGDGICDSSITPHPAGCPFGPTGYEGPGVSFSSISADLNSGTIQFSPGIKPGGSAYFGLEGVPSAIVRTQPPQLSALNPTSIRVGSASFQLTVTGSNFGANDQVQWTPNPGGQPTLLTPTTINPLSITVQVPANLVAASGTATIAIVQTSPSLVSNTAQFVINPSTPVITALSPVSAVAGGATFALVISGSNFANGAQVQWTNPSNKVTTLTPTSITSAQLAVNIDSSLIAAAGTASVAVVLPVAGAGSLVSNSVQLPISALSITSISPSSVSAFDGDTPITLSGTGFQSGAQVTVMANGQSVLLTNLSVTPAQISATIPGSALSGPLSGIGTGTVTVSEGSATTSTQITIAPPTGKSIPNVAIKLATQPNSPTDQPTLTVTSSNPTTAGNFVAVLALSFTPNASNVPTPFSNPGVSFSTGHSSVCFPLPAGPSSSPAAIDLTSLQNGMFSQGTVAGTIQIASHLYYGASCTADHSSVQGSPTELTPASSPLSLTVAQQAPVVTSNPQLTNVTPSGFNVELNAYSTTRDLTTISFTFTAASGTQLTGTTVFNNVSISPMATQWFSSSGSLPTGGSFHLSVPFTYSGNTGALGSASVIIANSIGPSSATSPSK